ncbi:putative sulfate transporter 3.4 [Apostasia shenzhenica]|uniref:Putative sulfate transporter 3.4 n=1 Tax=Apostasia shenzhenica TaxID=1088818 RepID=A0A2I0B6J5_9ASPA|nr:putative sulfate transporter 3.4 [Apostasia shenzhenica]
MGGGSSIFRTEVIADQEASLPSALQEIQHLNIHKVSSPEAKSAFPALKQGLCEVFFPDDPLHRFKNQSLFRKLLLALHYLFPILEWGSGYNLHLLKSDAIAGFTIASLSIPQGISYAKLANLPPIVGLYTTFVPPLIYAAMGSSRDLAIGPNSISSLVLGSILREVVSPEEEPELYLQLAFTATFFAGAFQTSLGLFRLGFVMDFLSKPTLMGFMGGAAMLTTMQQMKNLLGIRHFTAQTRLVAVILSVLEHKTEWTWETILMGFSFLLLILMAKYVSSKKPWLFWISAVAPITSMILSTIIVYAAKAQNHGIKTIGRVEESINPSSASMLIFRGPLLRHAVKAGIATGIFSLTEGLAAGRTFASRRNYEIEGNKEMTSIGVMNMIGSCVSCYVASGSISRSAVNHSAGCKTAFSNIVMALLVLFIMTFLMPIFYYTPTVILSVIIIMAVIKLIDFKAAIHLWKVDKLDFVTCLAAFLGVIFISVQIGLAIAVGISLVKILMHVTRPKIVIMGNVPGTRSYRNLEQYKDAIRIPSFLILGVESPIYFANSTYFQDR